MTARRSPRPSRYSVVLAIGGTVAGSLPVALIGALAPLMRVDIPLSDRGLGMTIATYYMASALASYPASIFIRRLGSRVLLAVTGVVLALTLTAGATVAGWPSLWVFAAVSGLANGVAQLAANHVVAVGVVPRRQGVAFGLKQSAIPVATLVAGLSLPLVAVPLGWRWAFGMAAVFAAVYGFLAISIRGSYVRGYSHGRQPLADSRALRLLTLTGGAAGMAGTTVAPFAVAYATARGVEPAVAGIMLATGAGAGVAMRIAVGALADAKQLNALTLMAVLLAIGALGMAGLAVAPGDAAIATGIVLSFAGAWGWPGLFLLAVSRVGKGDPARALATVAPGPLLGAIAGPLAFGFVAERTSYAVAWTGAATVAASAVALVAVARRQVHSVATE